MSEVNWDKERGETKAKRDLNQSLDGTSHSPVQEWNNSGRGRGRGINSIFRCFQIQDFHPGQFLKDDPEHPHQGQQNNSEKVHTECHNGLQSPPSNLCSTFGVEFNIQNDEYSQNVAEGCTSDENKMITEEPKATNRSLVGDDNCKSDYQQPPEVLEELSCVVQQGPQAFTMPEPRARGCPTIRSLFKPKFSRRYISSVRRENAATCPFRDLGCDYSGRAFTEEFREHLKRCQFRNYIKCFVPGCESSVPFGLFQNHLKDAHQTRTDIFIANCQDDFQSGLALSVVIKDEDISVPLVLTDPSYPGYLFPFVMRKTKGFMYIWVYQITARNIWKEVFVGDVRATLSGPYSSPLNTRQIGVNNALHDISVPMEEVIRSRHCVQIPLPTFDERYFFNGQVPDVFEGYLGSYLFKLNVCICEPIETTCRKARLEEEKERMVRAERKKMEEREWLEKEEQESKEKDDEEMKKLEMEENTSEEI